MARGKNPELAPHAVRHPKSGKFVPAPATGEGHRPESSADHAADIPGAGSSTYFVAAQGQKS